MCDGEKGGLEPAAYRSPQGTIYDSFHIYRMESEIKGDPEPLVAVSDLLDRIEGLVERQPSDEQTYVFALMDLKKELEAMQE